MGRHHPGRGIADRVRAPCELRIAIIGGGIAGLTMAVALGRRGFRPHIFEQAKVLSEVGAGLTMSPNAMKGLRALGLEKAVAESGFESQSIVGRDWKTGRAVFSIPLNQAPGYGAVHTDLHRADLLGILLGAREPVSSLSLDHKLVGLEQSEADVVLTFQNGRTEKFDLVIGCDGIHSVVQRLLHPHREPRFTGNVCWRMLTKAEHTDELARSPDVTIWMGNGGHVVTYLLRQGSLVNTVAVLESEHWTTESWSSPAHPDEVIRAFSGIHPALLSIFENAASCMKLGLFDRDPLPTWSWGRVTLAGDAAHALLPFLGQGAAMGIEDAVVLASELARFQGDMRSALRAYQAARIPRTTRVLHAVRSQAVRFHRPVASNDARPDMDWLYGFDPVEFEET